MTGHPSGAGRRGVVSVSTGVFPELVAGDAAKALVDAGASAIELSGGVPTDDPLADLADVIGLVPLRVHNYFPPSRDPFVFNLASADPEVARRSIGHVEGALRLVRELGGAEYSFHAGFLIDPGVDELGRPIHKRPLIDRDEALSRFVERVNSLAQSADADGICLLVENNVVSEANRDRFGGDPLLMSQPDECAEVMRATATNVYQLVDVAHLKVSAQSLAFDPVRMFTLCAEWIRGYHLSDNDGRADTNEPIRPDSWFWEHLDPDVAYQSVEVKGLRPHEYVDQACLVTRTLEALPRTR